jgi:dihydrofolate reductase
MERKLFIYLAMSLDGYIAKEDGDISWLDKYLVEGEDYGYSNFINSVNTVIVGRKTYDKVISMINDFPHKTKDCYIITHSSLPAEGNIKFFNGNLKTLVEELKANEGKNIFCDGGAEIINLLLKNQLVDEFIISVIPEFLSKGIRLFNEGLPEMHLELIEATPYPTGLVKVHYRKKIVK